MGVNTTPTTERPANAPGQPSEVVAELQARFGTDAVSSQETADGLSTVWTPADKLRDLLHHLKNEAERPYRALYDITAIDERERNNRQGQPPSDFSVVYHLLSYDRNQYIRVKAALHDSQLSVPTVTDLWPGANWYEREIWDMFGIRVEGHPHLERILLPKWWVGHPLRKEHPARATEMGRFVLPEEREEREQELLRFRPEDWGMKRSTETSDFIFLNI